jgi:hypothetical protein
MKKLLLIALALAITLAPAVPVYAAPVSKAAYDAFAGKTYTANNSRFTVDEARGILLDTDSQAGWYIVISKALEGSIDVGYKIGPDYYLRTIEIDSGRSTRYRLGDGSGNKGLNQVKIGAFRSSAEVNNPVIDVNIGFIGYYLHDGSVLSTSIYWQKLNKGGMVDWGAVRSAYDTWAAQGGLPLPNPVRGWQSSGRASIFFEGGRPAIGFADFTAGMLESHYLSYYLDPGYDRDSQHKNHEPQPRAYTVVYDANGGTGTPPADTTSYEPGRKKTVLDRGELYNRWHTFLGWSITPDGPVAYTPGQGFAVNGDTTLFAAWSEYDKFTVRYDGNGNTGGSPPSDTSGNANAGNVYYNGSMVTVLGSGTLAKTGHSFKGWALSPGGAAAYNPGGKFNITDEVTLSAVWLADTVPTYTVTYQPGLRGIFEAQSWENLPHGAAKPPPPLPEGAEGWEFIGWNPSPAATVTDNATYVAEWEQKVYEVEFEDWDGTKIGERDVAHGGNAASPPDPERDGYVFTGWDQEPTDIRGDAVVKALYAPVTEAAALPDNNKTLENLVSAGVPTLIIGNAKVPLAGLPGTHNVWALLNLILAALGILSAAATAIYGLARKKYDGYDFRHKRDKWLLAGVLAGIAGIALFIITQNIRHLMVLVDLWTIAHAALFAAAVTCSVLAVRKRKRGHGDYEPVNDV